jgi:hypothetical protein
MDLSAVGEHLVGFRCNIWRGKHLGEEGRGLSAGATY